MKQTPRQLSADNVSKARVNQMRLAALDTRGLFAMLLETLMLKNTLIFALLATAGFVASAQTTPAPKTAPAAATAVTPAKPAAAAPTTPAAPAAAAAKAGEEPAVKKSKNNICHDKTSSSYKQTTNFTAYKTMDECTKSGGRPPKASK